MNHSFPAQVGTAKDVGFLDDDLDVAVVTAGLPWGMAVWDRLRDELDGRIKESGAENAYFPLLIPRSFLSKEAEHGAGKG